MAINQTSIIIKAIDEATPTFNKLEAGSKNLGNAFDQTAKKTNGLTSYMKEQRMEGRRHSFVIGEIKDSLAVAGLAMNMMAGATGKQSEEFKKINDSVNKSIIAFMGLDAIVSTLSKTFKAFGGWVGTAITIIGSLGFAVISYFNNTKELNKELETEVTAHERIVASLKEVENKFYNLSAVKAARAKADKEATEDEIKKLNEWIETDKTKLDKIIAGGVVKEGIQQQEFNRLAEQIEFNKELLRQREKDYEAIKKTELLESVIADTRKKRFNILVTDIQKITNIKPLIEVQMVVKPIKKLDFKLPKVDVPEFNPLKNLEDEWDKSQANFETAMQHMTQAVNIFQGFSNAGFDERMNNYDKELSKLNEFYDTNIKRVNDDYNNRIMIAQGDAALQESLEAEKNAKIIQLEEQKAARQLIIEEKIKSEKIKKFKADQNAAIIETIINGAVGVSRALRSGSVFEAILAGALTLAQIAIIKSQPTPSFHTGGGMFFNAPANQERPVMIRGQETIRVTTPSQERKQGGGVVINFNSPVSDVEFVKNSIKKVLKNTGLTIEKSFVNPRNKISFA